MRFVWTRVFSLCLISACSSAHSESSPPLEDGEGKAEAQLLFPFEASLSISEEELSEEISEAVELRTLSFYEKLFDALDPGEAIEHATISQLAIDLHQPSLEILFNRGDELFEYEFRLEDGLGNGLAGRPGVRAGRNAAPNRRRVHKSRFGGPDSYSCASCHSKGGPDGAGSNTQNAYLRGNGNDAIRADERNAPHLLGLGPVQALAEEISRELLAQKQEAIYRAAESNREFEVQLSSKNISFGKILARPDGSVDFSGVQGVAADLIVRPFGWKGHQASIRDMAEESFRIHMGVISSRIQNQAEVLPKEDFGDGGRFDLDRDGIGLELDPGMLSSMAIYLAQLEIPVSHPPQDELWMNRHASGRELFAEIGCAECHRPELVLLNPRIEVRPREERFGESAPIVVNVAVDGELPKLRAVDKGQGYRVELFSDLRRHDMGPQLHSGYKEGDIGKSVFLTRPLWGVADTAPYLHDGRAPTLRDAIRWHGGESLESAENFSRLPKRKQDDVLLFLSALGRSAGVMTQ